MLPPNSTIRTVDIFQCEGDASCVCDVFVTTYNESGGQSNKSLVVSYEREGGFLAAVRYFRQHGYEKVHGSLTGPSKSFTGRWHVSYERVTVPDFPMPFVPAKYTILDDSEVPF